MSEPVRPSDLDLTLYINYLELALADAGARVITNSARMERVRAWAVPLRRSGRSGRRREVASCG